MYISSFRFKALVTHLLFSSLVIASIAAISLLVWFPYPYYEIDGTLIALVIVFCVDIVIGPIITFVISNNNKPYRELLFDFSIVLLLQVSALVFGISEIYKQRVVALMHIEGQFHLVAKSAVPQADAEPNLNVFEGVYYGQLTYPDFEGLSEQEREEKMFSPSTYKQLSLREVESYALPMHALPETLIKQYGDQVYYKLIAGKNKNGVAVVNHDMQIIDIAVLEG